MDKKAFFASIKLKSEKFTLPTGDVIELHELTAGDRDKVLPEYKQETVATAQAKIVALCCVDFNEEDVSELLKLPSDLLTSMAEVALRLSGLVEGQDEKKG